MWSAGNECKVFHSDRFLFSMIVSRTAVQVRSVHGKLKPHKCDQCEASFGFKDGLRRHKQMIHDQTRPYPCSYCTMKFKTKAHVNKHSLAVHPEKHGGSSSTSGRGGRTASGSNE